MRNVSEQKESRINAVSGWLSRIPALTRVLGGILLFTLLCNSVQAGQSVALFWDPSVSPDVAGYDLYYGVASRTYTNMVDVENVTNTTVSGLVEGTTYYFAVASYDIDGLSSAFSNEASYNVPTIDPAITTQPQSQAVPAGSTVTLTVAAAGTPAFDYQWCFNSASISGEVGTSLTITNFQSSNEGDYDVLVTNELGSVASETAGLYLAGPLRFVNPYVDSNGWFWASQVGPAGSNFVVEASTNLLNWTPFATNPAPFGILSFTDTNQCYFTNNSGISSYRFYRAWLAP